MTAPNSAMLEKDWQRTVRDLAQTLGYRRAYHTFDSRRSDTGFPDLVLVSTQRKRVVFLELKRDKGKLSERQAEWVRALHTAGAEVYVARPRHFDLLARALGSYGADHAEARAWLLLELDEVLNRYDPATAPLPEGY